MIVQHIMHISCTQHTINKIAGSNNNNKLQRRWQNR